MDDGFSGCAGARVHYLDTPPKPQLYRQDLLWEHGRLMGESPDSHGRLQGDNFGLRRTS